MLPLIAMGVSMAGSLLNGRAQADAQVRAAEAATDDIRKKIAFEADQRAQNIDFSQKTLGEILAIERKNLNNELMDRERMIREQQALISAEQQRQQSLARGGRDTLDTSTALYGNYEGQIGDRANTLAHLFMDSITGADSGATAPAATGAVADREAAMRDRKRADVVKEVASLAGMRGFSDLFGDTTIAQNRNSQVADILRNFADGSERTLAPALKASSIPLYVREKFAGANNFIKENYTPEAPLNPNATSSIGDLFKVAGSGLGLYSMMGGKMPTFGSGTSNNYSLMPESGNFSGIGLRDTGGAPSLGLSLGGNAGSGLQLPKGLGIN